MTYTLKEIDAFIAQLQKTRKRFWSIEEADKGGMIGGYPRWLDENGHYYAMYPTQDKFMKFASREEVEASEHWAKVKDNPEYKIMLWDYAESPKPLSIDQTLVVLLELKEAKEAHLDRQAEDYVSF